VNQKLAKKLLQKMGHEVSVAANGAEACEEIQHQEFDLVLMDLQMPVMGGLQATRKIRENEQGTGRHTPIVAMDRACRRARSAAVRGSWHGRVCQQADTHGILTKRD